MPRATFNSGDLPAEFFDLDRDTQCQIIRIGLDAYKSVQAGVRELVVAELSEDDAAKAAAIRAEGIKSALESVRSRLAMADTLEEQLHMARTKYDQLRATVENDAEIRAKGLIADARKDFEVEKAQELAELKEQIAEMRGREKTLQIVEEAHEGMKETISTLQAELAKYKAAAGTKSSHALGKMGEAEVFAMLNTYVIPRFPYAEVRDMTAVKHVGDFHISLFGPTGKRLKLMLDVKKYSYPVQNGEVEKLYSDLDGDSSDAGIMVSLDTSICTKSQFQLTKTKMGKPCMFLTFEKLDDGIRQEVLCWALRVLTSVVSTTDRASQDAMITEIQAFIGEMTSSVTEVEACVKACKTLYDMLRDTKDRLLARINTFKGIDPSDDVIVHDGDDMRCKCKNANGGQCKSRRVPTGNLCTRHEAAVAAGKTVLLMTGAVATASVSAAATT
jgi:hypothetical protein